VFTSKHSQAPPYTSPPALRHPRGTRAPRLTITPPDQHSRCTRHRHTVPGSSLPGPSPRLRSDADLDCWTTRWLSMDGFWEACVPLILAIVKTVCIIEQFYWLKCVSWPRTFQGSRYVPLTAVIGALKGAWSHDHLKFGWVGHSAFDPRLVYRECDRLRRKSDDIYVTFGFVRRSTWWTSDMLMYVES